MTKKTIPAAECRALSDGHAEIIITTEAVDRMRDRVIQAGLTFPATVPVLFGHDAHSLPVGVSGRASMIRGPQQTRARWTWIEGDARAAAVRNVFQQGALAASVGMLVHADEPNKFGGRDITRAEVVEFSLVTIPANAECVRLLKSLGWSARGDDAVGLDLDDEDVGLTPADVRAAVRALVPAMARAAVVARARGQEAEDIGLSREDVFEAFRIVIPGLLRREMNRLRGRVD